MQRLMNKEHAEPVSITKETKTKLAQQCYAAIRCYLTFVKLLNYEQTLRLQRYALYVMANV